MNSLARRDVLAAGAVALAGVAPGAPRPGKVTFGANSLSWPGFSRAVPLAGVTRVYWHGLNRIEPRWPRYGRARVVLSVEPRPRDLLAGRLDGRFRQLASTAPPGSMLVPWYEAGPANPRDYYSFVNAANTRACQGYLHRLLRHTNVRVGSIICGPASQLEDWIAPGLPWYGVDINGDWFRQGSVFEVARFRRRQAQNLAVWRRKAAGRVRLVIAETNCSADRERGPWLNLLAGWWAQHGLASVDISTYWAVPGRVPADNDGAVPAGSGTGPWPPSERTIDALVALSEKYSGRYSVPW